MLKGDANIIFKKLYKKFNFNLTNWLVNQPFKLFARVHFSQSCVPRERRGKNITWSKAFQARIKNNKLIINLNPHELEFVCSQAVFLTSNNTPRKIMGSRNLSNHPQPLIIKYKWGWLRTWIYQIDVKFPKKWLVKMFHLLTRSLKN